MISLRVRRGGTPLLLVDCQPVCYAAFFAHGPLSHRGQPTGVIYGFLRRIFDLCDRFKTNRVLFFWDSVKTYRYDYFPEYKIGRLKRREQMEAEDIIEHRNFLDQMVKLSKQVLPKIGFKNNILFHGYEADDLIGYVLKHKKQKGRKIIISNDADLYQLLTYADMYLFAKEEIFTKTRFKRRFGIPVEKWVEAKSIGGCSSDDIPGIEGVSDPKNLSSKALKYLRGELSKGVIMERIRSNEGKKIIERNRELQSLPFAIDKIPPFDIVPDTVTVKKIIQCFNYYGFDSLCQKDYLTKIEKYFG